MKTFDANILETLNKECNGDCVHYIGLGAYDFQMSFGNLDRIRTMEKAVFSMSGRRYSWMKSPSNIPFGLLIEQVPNHFELPNLLVLRMCFKSGDFVEFHTAESAYESVVIDLGVRDGVHVIEVF
jgi:hypothetical protein